MTIGSVRSADGRAQWLLALLLAVVVPVTAGEWDWHLSADRYQKLNMFERAQYDKAANLFAKQQYDAAATEFQKFRDEFQTSPVGPYALFMSGYALYQTKHRNEAIKVFQDVLDLYGDKVEDAAPALYLLGLANLDNGDAVPGMKALKEMVEDEDYRQHPLAAGALRRLADNHWRNKERDLAIKYWKQAANDFWEKSSGEANAARNNVTTYYIRGQLYADYENWLINDDNRDKPAHRVWVASQAWDVAWNGFAGDWEKYNQFNQKEKAADMKAFYQWFVRQQDWYVKQKNEWEFYTRQLQFLAYRWHDPEGLKAALEQTIQWVSKLDNKQDANGKFAWIVDRLREGRKFAQARYCVSKMTDPAYAAFKEYEILGHGEGNWGAAAAKLIEIMKMDNKYWHDQAQNTLAWVYKDATREYDKALKVYEEINAPPGTLWAIQECYYRMAKLKEALTTLVELENSFPDQAARAAWQRAWYYKEAGNREQAIKEARRIMKQYKTAGEASNAHQLLEQYGVETGGGVTNQD